MHEHKLLKKWQKKLSSFGCEEKVEDRKTLCPYVDVQHELESSERSDTHRFIT